MIRENACSSSLSCSKRSPIQQNPEVDILKEAVRQNLSASDFQMLCNLRPNQITIVRGDSSDVFV